MRFSSLALAAALTMLPALASAQMVVDDSYARASSAMAISGAAFMTLTNTSDVDDRLIAATSSAAERLELHTHLMEDGVMRMVEVEEGIALPAGETVTLERGGLHVMMLGLTEPLVQGEEIEVTFTFETADPVTQTITIDNERQPGHGGMEMDHGDMNHGGHGDEGGMEMDHGDHEMSDG